MQIKALGAMGFKGTAQSSLLAGLLWPSGTPSGSRGRSASYSRWSAVSCVGARFLADPGIIMQLLTPMVTKLAKLTPWLESNSLLRNEQNTKQETEAG